MRTLTLEEIRGIIRDPDVLTAGQNLVENGNFQCLEYTEDESFYQGECVMGKRRYTVSADFQDPADPVFQCTCSRIGSLCKHVAGFLCCLSAGQGFRQVPLSGDIEKMRKDRAEKEARRATRARRRQGAGTGRDREAQRRQEGIALADQLRLDLVSAGLKSAAEYLLPWKERASQLGEYGLEELRVLYQSLFCKLEGAARNGEEKESGDALKILERIWALTEKEVSLFRERTKQSGPGGENGLLSGKMGGIRSRETVPLTGHTRQNVRLAQLAFWQTTDRERSCYTQTGVWADLGSGELFVTRNLRPWAYCNQRTHDTVFGAVSVPEIRIDPEEGNRRISWEEETPGEMTPGDLSFLRAQAGNSLEKGIQAARTVLRDPLKADMVFALFRYRSFGRVEDQLVVLDQGGIPVGLADMPGMPPSAGRIPELPDPALLENQVLLGGIWYRRDGHAIQIQPLSLLTENSVVRLLY